MKKVNISTLKNTLINEGIYLTAWVRQKTTQTKVKIKQKQIYFEGRLPAQWLRQQEEK